MKKEFKIFVDFDGTITEKDVGEEIFRMFGDPVIVKDVIDRLLEDEISSKECWIQLCNSVKFVDKNAINKLIDKIPIDETFHNLVDYCSSKGYELFVLSDGFDYYIDRIFRREKLEKLKVYANKLEFTSDNKLQPSFPFLDENSVSSANCKRNHIINHSSDDDFTFYIGDGNSDKYTAQFCDFIFAKKDLLKFCEKNRVSYFPFNNFDDVIKRIETLAVKRNLKKRHQAELKRKEAYRVE